MDDGDLTDVIKRSIIFLSEAMNSGKGGLKMRLSVMCLKEAVTIRLEENAWVVEMIEDGRTVILKRFEKEPSINQISQILQQYFRTEADPSGYAGDP